MFDMLPRFISSEPLSFFREQRNSVLKGFYDNQLLILINFLFIETLSLVFPCSPCDEKLPGNTPNSYALISKK